jgi:hypothetical protein
MAKGTEDLPQFGLRLGFLSDRFGDFQAQNLAITLA